MATAAVALERFTPRARPRTGRLARVALSALVLIVLGPLAVMNIAAAMDPSSTGTGQGFAHGPAIVSTSTGALTFGNAAPGAKATEVVTVRTPGGSSGVELSATITGTGLDRFVHVTVVRGSVRGGAFRADLTDHSGLGARVVYEGTLAGLGTEVVADPAGSWDRGEVHSYRIVGTLDDANAAQGLSASVDLSWTALTD